MTSVPASQYSPGQSITKLMEVRLHKHRCCHAFIYHRSGAAAVAQRLVHELQNGGSCNNPGFESLAAVGDPHRKEDKMADYFTEREKAEAEYAATNTVRADFISRQKAIDWMKNEWDGMVVSVFDGIEHLPSADAVEVVWCKDCKHYYHADNRIPSERGWVCANDGCYASPNDYCSWGKKKDGRFN